MRSAVAGATVQRATTGPVPPVRTFMYTDYVQARAAAQAAENAIPAHRPRAVVYCSIISTLLWPAPGVVWLDTLTAENRPGRHGLWQRVVERRRLAEARLVLTMSDRSLAPVRNPPDSIVVPTPVDPSGPPAPERDKLILTYAGNPEKKRIDFVLETWARARRAGRDPACGRSRPSPAHARGRGGGRPAEAGRVPRAAPAHPGVPRRTAPRGFRHRSARGAGRRLPGRDHARARPVPRARARAPARPAGSSATIWSARSGPRSTTPGPGTRRRRPSCSRPSGAPPSTKQSLNKSCLDSWARDHERLHPEPSVQRLLRRPVLLSRLRTRLRVRGDRGDRRSPGAAPGDPKLVNEVAMWGFPAGLIGGRIYFLITTPSQIPPHWWGPFAIWQGGLGIWGGIACGTLAGLWVLRRRHADIPAFLDAAAPALLVAQAIGRVGNYFNQELFGKPTTLPWGLRDRSRSPAARLRPVQHLPAHLPLRDHLEPVARRLPRLARPHAPCQGAGAVRPLRRRLLGLSHVRGDAADRLLQPRARPSPELLRRGGAVPRPGWCGSWPSSGAGGCAAVPPRSVWPGSPCGPRAAARARRPVSAGRTSRSASRFRRRRCGAGRA